MSIEEAYIDDMDKSELYPIAVNKYDKDIFFINISNSSRNGIVIWYASEEIQRWKCFIDFFESIILYNERELAKYR